jgi:hypothetical protein
MLPIVFHLNKVDMRSLDTLSKFLYFTDLYEFREVLGYDYIIDNMII